LELARRAVRHCASHVLDAFHIVKLGLQALGEGDPHGEVTIAWRPYCRHMTTVLCVPQWQGSASSGALRLMAGARRAAALVPG
jgi:hypothetical protein